MLNPWILLAVALAFAASNAGSYIYGGNVREAQIEAKSKKDQDKVIAEFNATAEKDKRQAVAAAAKEAAAKTRATMTRNAANEAIRSKPLPALCNWEPKSYGLLVSAVKEANGTDAADGAILPNAVRRANRTGKPER